MTPKELRTLRAEARAAGDNLTAALCGIALGYARADLRSWEHAALGASDYRRVRAAGARRALEAARAATPQE